jgi:hypothetical protein
MVLRVVENQHYLNRQQRFLGSEDSMLFILMLFTGNLSHIQMLKKLLRS